MELDLEGYLNDYASNPDNGDFGERSAGNVIYYGNKKAVYAIWQRRVAHHANFTINAGLRYEYTGSRCRRRNLQPLNSISNVPG